MQIDFKKISFIFFCVIVVLIIVYMTDPLQATMQKNIHTIVLTDSGFDPSKISIKDGDTVVFSTDRSVWFWPASDLHPVHSVYPELDSLRPLDPEETWSFTFTKKGVWDIHDHMNSFFKGTIIVE